MYVQGCQECEVCADCPRHGAEALRQAEKEAYSEFLERVEFIRQAFDAIDQAGVPLQLQEKVRSVLSGWQGDTVYVAFLAFKAGTLMPVVPQWEGPLPNRRTGQ